MNKSIKYAGVAAATLLTVAPIAAPAFSNNALVPQENTAKATFNKNTQEDAYQAFDATFKNYNNATKLDFIYGAGFTYLETNNRFTYTGHKLDGIVKPLHPQYQSFLNDSRVSLALNEITFLVVPAAGETPSEWQNDMKAAGLHGGTVSYRIVGLPMQDVLEHITMSNQQLVKQFAPAELNGHVLDKTVTASTGTVDQTARALNINFDTPVDGYVGEKRNDFYTNGKYPLTIKDNKGNNLAPSDVTSSFFKGANLATPLVFSELPEAGIVTQKMTVKFNRSEYAGWINDLKQITINGQTYSGGLLHKIWDKINNSVTLTRQINVTLDNYTNSDVYGVVTTPVVNMGDKNITTNLYDAKGNVIHGRSLAQGTDWFTDIKRVNNNGGETYYRVSTNEYVKAADVSYRDKDKDTNTGDGSEAALKDVTDLPEGSVVELGGIPGYVYSIFDINGTQSKVRHLASGTTWRTDKKATDGNGDTYYRVSSNEWVHQGDGVTLK